MQFINLAEQDGLSRPVDKSYARPLKWLMLIVHLATYVSISMLPSRND